MKLRIVNEGPKPVTIVQARHAPITLAPGKEWQGDTDGVAVTEQYLPFRTPGASK